ncbi:hypothetical protein ABPG74_018850 [Tetrahymena malaccensis]
MFGRIISKKNCAKQSSLLKNTKQLHWIQNSQEFSSFHIKFHMKRILNLNQSEKVLRIQKLSKLVQVWLMKMGKYLQTDLLLGNLISTSMKSNQINSFKVIFSFNQKCINRNDQIKQESLDLLKNAGIDFKELKKRGISREQFADLVSESDIILNEELTWIVFHGGFDFAYLLQMLYGSPIPDSSTSFYNLLKSFFPNVYDVKYLIKDLQYMKDSGLNKVAQELKVDRIGPQHQAGSDSLLTLGVFFKLRDDVLQQKMKKSINVIYGIGEGFIVSKTKDYLQHYKLKYHQQYQDMDYTHQNFMNQQMPNMTDYFEQMFTNMNPFQQFSAHKIIQNLSNHQNNMQMGYYSPFFSIMQQAEHLNMIQGHKNMDAIYKKKYSSAKM